MARGPLCLRLPEDLHAAVHHMAAEQGVSSSEWIRDLIFRVVYDQPLGMEEGYLHGRAIGVKAVMIALRSLAVPETAEEAMRLLQTSTSPGRTPFEPG
jgi:hypothetical protein